MKKALLFIIILIGICISCEKDDICSDATANTPHLIIKFFDIGNTSEVKTVNNLRFTHNSDDETNAISVTDRDSILIPLRILADNTSFRLTKDYTFDDNGTPDDSSDDIHGGNTDDITISYTNEQIFISRACGYKNIYSSTSIGFNDGGDDDNWISTTDVIQTTIENENNAHIYIYH